MPKSRNRTDHKKKSKARVELKKRKDEKMRKEFFSMLKKAQDESKEKSLQEAQKDEENLVVDTTESNEVSDFQID